MHHLEGMIWALIPIAAIFAGVAKHWFSLKERQLDTMAQNTANTAAVTSAETERLKQRIAVLERIVTDRSTQLGDEIEALRDRPHN